MKLNKALALILAAMMTASMVSCGGKSDENTNDTTTDTVVTEAVTTAPAETEAAGEQTMGSAIVADFKAKIAETPDMSAEDMANALLGNAVLSEMSMMVAPMADGSPLMGLELESVTGFAECAAFAPMIGTIPFMGYIFKLADGADVEAFKQMLKDNANPRWNICTEADETFVESEGNTVLFLMSPISME